MESLIRSFSMRFQAEDSTTEEESDLDPMAFFMSLPERRSRVGWHRTSTPSAERYSGLRRREGSPATIPSRALPFTPTAIGILRVFRGTRKPEIFLNRNTGPPES